MRGCGQGDYRQSIECEIMTQEAVPFCSSGLILRMAAYWQTLLLQPHSILSHGFAALVIAGVSAKGEALRQPEEAMLALPFRHDHPQQDDEEDDDNSHREQVEKRGVSGSI